MPTDLGTFTFLWERSANTDFSDTPVTLQDSASTTYLLTDDDANAAFIRVTVSYTDGGGFSETIISAVRQTETLPDRAPTGAPVITGDRWSGSNPHRHYRHHRGRQRTWVTFSFLWERSANTDFSDTPVTLQDSTSTTYLLTDDDAAAFIRVTVSYTDGGGFSETITSAVRQISHATRPRTHRRTGHHRRRTDAGQTLTVTTDTITDANGLGHLHLPVGTQCQYRLQRYACHTTRLGQHHLSAHR